jgi:catechol 2,3-dioxygenase-like lactoylglutathione lyase family enzyme
MSAQTATALLRGVHHMSFAVSDLERSIAFYQALGFTIHDRWEEGPERCAPGLGVPGADIEVAQLNGPGVLLELMWYRAPSGTGTAPAPADVGCAHIAFATDDIHAAAEAVAAAGAGMVSQVQTDPVAHWVQFTDPDGIRLELIQMVAK